MQMRYNNIILIMQRVNLRILLYYYSYFKKYNHRSIFIILFKFAQRVNLRILLLLVLLLLLLLTGYTRCARLDTLIKMLRTELYTLNFV